MLRVRSPSVRNFSVVVDGCSQRAQSFGKAGMSHGGWSLFHAGVCAPALDRAPTDTPSTIHYRYPPLGGEDLTRYAGGPRLVRATGTAPFDTVADGTTMIEHPELGEVVWCDDAGVTCRRWNWRQARRTQLSEDTTAALFILDALDPMTDQALHAAADDLATHLTRLGPDVRVVRRLIAAGAKPG